MKTKELVELIKQGARPIIRIKDDDGFIEGPDPGMLGRIIGVGEEDKWDRGTSTIPFKINFFEFTEQNKTAAIANWYDSTGQPTLTWMETERYARDAKVYEVYEMYIDKHEYSDLQHLELVEENGLISQYIKSNSSMTYIEWLEDQLTNYKRYYE